MDDGASETPLLLLHGSTANADTWLASLLLGRRPTPFLLVDAGIDVWLAHNRGALHYADNTVMSEEEKWSYNYHTMAKDLPPQIELVLEKTGAEKIDFGAYSRGTMVAFYAFAKDPDYYASRIENGVMITPCFFGSDDKYGLEAVIDYSWEHTVEVVRDLEPAYMWGEDWPARRKETFCNGETPKLCKAFKTFFNMIEWSPQTANELFLWAQNSGA